MAEIGVYEGFNHPWRTKTPDLQIPFEPPLEAWQESILRNALLTVGH
jgi:hypothetical protein